MLNGIGPDTPCTPWDYPTRSNPSPRNKGRTTSWDKLGADDVVANGAPHAWNDGSECGLISAESAEYRSPEPEPSYPANATQESLQFGTKSVWWSHSWHFPCPIISHHFPLSYTWRPLSITAHEHAFTGSLNVRSVTGTGACMAGDPPMHRGGATNVLISAICAAISSHQYPMKGFHGNGWVIHDQTISNRFSRKGLWYL